MSAKRAMSDSIALRKWLDLKRVHDKCLDREKSLMNELGDARKSSYKVCMELHRLAGLVIQAGEQSRMLDSNAKPAGDE